MGKKKRIDDKNKYECAVCHGVYEKGWSDEEARAEFDLRFPGVPFSETGLVCDYCNDKLEAWLRSQGLSTG